MTSADWIGLSMPVITIIGGLWYINRLSVKSDMDAQRVKDLEKQIDKKDDEIKFLYERIDRKDEVIRNLK
jgi:hypothetical protein